jgi:hypothetical protein
MFRGAFHSQDQSNQRAQQLQVLQLKNMRFADEYVGAISAPIRRFQETSVTAADRLLSQNWLLSQSTAAYTIASGPSPVVNAVDMVVLATLSRMVIDDVWSSERFGDRAAPLRAVYVQLEPQAVNIAKAVLPPEQIAELQRILIEWRAKNPHVTAVAYMHFRDIATSTTLSTSDGNSSLGGLFTMLGLDPFSSIDPAVREIARTRELAERTIYYAQHVPNLLDMQVERLTFQFATMPETTRLLGDAESIAGAADATGRLMAELPSLLTREREAAIRQFTDAITLETANTQQFVIELRRSLEAGTVTANSLNRAIVSFDQLMTNIKAPGSGGGASQPPSRPFNITEYTAAAAEITRSASELEKLISDAERGGPALSQGTADMATALKQVVEVAYWRVLQLIALLLVGGLVVALLYRGIARRWLA